MDSGTPNDLPTRYLVRLAWENRTMDEQSADLEDLAETFSRDKNRNRHLNSLVVPTTLERFEQGTDSIEALRQRVADITARPESQPHTIWNAQNFLEQVEAAMEEKE